MILRYTPLVAKSKRLVHLTFQLAVLGLLPATACAITSNFINNAGGAFNDAANFDNGVPGDSDVAVFDRGSGIAYSVTFSEFGHGQNIINDRLIVGSNTVTFNPNVHIGMIAADYYLDNGTTIEAHAVTDAPVRGITIGADLTDTAAVLISHLSILEAVAATLGHASGSNGTLTLNQDNDVLNITGASSSDAELIIGRLGTGVLNISGGADVNVNGANGNAVLGQGANSTGIATITGAGSTWTNVGTLTVGNMGNGTLTITAGGRVTTAGGAIGGLTGSNGMVTVSGDDGSGNPSTWNYTFGSLVVGNQVKGTLQIADGGQVVGGAGSTFIDSPSTIDPPSTSSSSLVSVDGINSLFRTRHLTVGLQGNGRLEITRGAVVSQSIVGDALIGSGSFSTGTVTVDGMGSS